MKSITVYLLATLVVFAPPLSVAAVDVEGVRFDASVDVGGQQLELHGTGLLRYMVFIRAYVGALYLESPVPSEQVLGPVAKQLVLEYFHPITKEDFAKATRKKIADNLSPAELAALSPRIEELANLYQDVKPGDRYALTHVPGEGVDLSLNGQWLGRVDGDDFARAAFAIWLGANPIDTRFRDQLLGDA